jgi:HEAT repeat protein
VVAELEYGSGLQTALTYGVIAMLGFVLLMFLVLVALRFVSSRRERRFAQKKEQINSVLSDLLASDASPADALQTLRDTIPPSDWNVLEVAVLESIQSEGDGRAGELTYISENMGFVEEDIENLAGGSDAKKAESAFHLGIVGSRRAVGALLDTLSVGTDEDVVFACLDALSHIGTPGAIDGVAKYLASHGELRNIRIAEVLLERGPEFAPHVRQWLQVEGLDSRRLNFLLKVAGALEDTSMVEPVSGYLAHPEPSVRANAARALGLLGDTGACRSLERAMGEGAVAVRVEAAEALGRLGCGESIVALERGLGDPDMKVRRGSAFALTRLGTRGRLVLEELTAVSEPEERLAVVEALDAERVKKNKGKNGG